MAKVADILRKTFSGPECQMASYRITKVSDGDQQLITGQVYAPDVLDAHGHYMTKEELQKVAHDFMRNRLTHSIDLQHNNRLVSAHIVESFIARKGDPDFDEGAWVATVKIDDDVVWKAIKDGEINGYSFEILTFRKDTIVEIEFEAWYYGFTDPDPHDKHYHPFMVRMDENGGIAWGKTGPGSDGSPAHTITNSNITDATDGRTHRIHLRNT